MFLGVGVERLLKLIIDQRQSFESFFVLKILEIK